MKQEKESLSVKLTENGQKDEAFTNTCSSLEDTLRYQEREGGARQFWRKKTAQQLLEVKEDTKVAEGRNGKNC